MSVGTVLWISLVLLLVGGVPSGSYSMSLGYLSVLLVGFIGLLFARRI